MLKRFTATMCITAWAGVCVGVSMPAWTLEPLHGHNGWRAQGPAAIAYLSLPFGGAHAIARPAYGLALTAPTLRSYSTQPRMITTTPKLLDLRFEGAAPNNLRIGGQLAWASASTTLPDDRRRHMFTSMDTTGWVLSIIGTGLLTWGVYELVGNGKECPSPFTVINGICGPNSSN